MLGFNLVGALAFLAASTAVNAGDYSMDMPCFNDICWTSWRCWYTRFSKYDSMLGDRCGVPDNVYTPWLDGSQWNTLVWGEKYMMTWTSSYAAQEDEIVLEWLMFAAPGTETPILANETDMYPNYRSMGPEKFVVAYSQNISAATTGWQFQPQQSWFPNEHLNVSEIEITAYAMERNVFRLYHPKTFNPHDSTTYDLSGPFAVIRGAEERMIRKAISNKGKAEKKKLAIGLGVGITATWIVAFLVSWFTSAWYQKMSMEKKGVLLE